MSFELANLKVFEDEHCSTQRVSSASNVDDNDSMGSVTFGDQKQDEVPLGNQPSRGRSTSTGATEETTSLQMIVSWTRTRGSWKRL